MSKQINVKYIVEAWVARDDDGSIYIYPQKPIPTRYSGQLKFLGKDRSDGTLFGSLFEEQLQSGDNPIHLKAEVSRIKE